MDEDHLLRGLTAMAAAGHHGNGNLAHFGAAVLAGYWFERDQELDPSAAAAMAVQAETMMGRFPELFAFPQRPGEGAGDPETMLECLIPNPDGVWAIGHDIIFTALALRSLRRAPELGDRWLVDGLGSVIAWCHDRPFTTVQVGDLGRVAASVEVGDASARELTGMPPVWDPAASARLALETMVGFDHVYPGLHQGHIGHVMDHAHALLTLDRLGYHRAAEEGYQGFLTHAARLRRAWHAHLDYPEAHHPLPVDPRRVAYWQRDHAENHWAYGHVFKYPYAFFDLAPLAGDPALTENAARVLARLT